MIPDANGVARAATGCWRNLIPPAKAGPGT